MSWLITQTWWKEKFSILNVIKAGRKKISLQELEMSQLPSKWRYGYLMESRNHNMAYFVMAPEGHLIQAPTQS